MQTTGYVVIQYGYGVLGLGATEAEAWADARADSGNDDLRETDEPRIDGGIYCLPASPALIEAVSGPDGGLVEVEVVGSGQSAVVVLADEAE